MGSVAVAQADWKSKLNTGGTLFAAGGALWLVHSILMIAAVVAIFSIQLQNIDLAILAAQVAGIAYLAATAAVLIAAFLIGAAFFVYQGGAQGLSWMDPMGGPRGVSAGTRSKMKLAGIFAMIYGVMGAVAVVFLALIPDAVQRADLGALQTYFQGVLAVWAIGAIVLLLAGIFTATSFRALKVDLASTESFGGTGFMVYAIINLVGVLMVVFPVFTLLSGTLALGLVIPLALGAIIELIVLPIIGIVVFALFTMYGLRLRTLQPGMAAAPMAAPYPSTYPPTPPPPP